MSKTFYSKKKCPECNGDQFISDYDNAEIVCLNCGFVIDEKMTDSGPEWRAFDDDQREKRARVGAPLTFTIHDKGLSTMIDWRDKDTYGKNLPPGQRAQVYRLRKWQRRARVSDATERNLAFALSELSKISSILNLPKNILETASVIYRRAVKKNLIRGRSIQGIAAAAVYMACRQGNVARTLDEIARASMVNRKKVGRSYRYITRSLEESVPTYNPSRYVSHFLNGLDLVGNAETLTIKILIGAKENGLTSGRSPLGMTAAAAYISSIMINDRRTQREVAEVVGVTEVTLRNRYKELVRNLDITVKL